MGHGLAADRVLATAAHPVFALFLSDRRRSSYLAVVRIAKLTLDY